MIKPTSMALFAIIALVGIGLGQHALADTQTISIKNMWNVKTLHVGDILTVINDDKINHSITGKDNRGDILDYNLAPGHSANIQFMFPVGFSYYDKYDQNSFGSIYTYDPSVDLTQVNVYNHTSINDLYEKPVYATNAYAPITGNSTNIPQNETVTFGSSNQTTPIVESAPNPISSNNTVINNKITSSPTNNDTMASLQSVVALQASEIADYKNQLGNATKEISFLQTQVAEWENVAERLSAIVQSLP